MRLIDADLMKSKITGNDKKRINSLLEFIDLQPTAEQKDSLKVEISNFLKNHSTNDLMEIVASCAMEKLENNLLENFLCEDKVNEAKE